MLLKLSTSYDFLPSPGITRCILLGPHEFGDASRRLRGLHSHPGPPWALDSCVSPAAPRLAWTTKATWDSCFWRTLIPTIRGPLSEATWNEILSNTTLSHAQILSFVCGPKSKGKTKAPSRPPEKVQRFRIVVLGQSLEEFSQLPAPWAGGSLMSLLNREFHCHWVISFFLAICGHILVVVANVESDRIGKEFPIPSLFVRNQAFPSDFWRPSGKKDP